MEDSSTLKHHDIVPGAQLSMHIWSSWLSLIQACVKGNAQKVSFSSCGPSFWSICLIFGKPEFNFLVKSNQVKRFKSW